MPQELVRGISQFRERAMLAGAMLLFATSFASAQELANAAPGLFRAVDVQTEAELISRDPRKLLEQKFHAKDGRFGIFEFDADVLSRSRGDFEVNVFGDKMTFKIVDFEPYGQGHHPSSGDLIFEMTGNAKVKRYPQSLSSNTMAITPEGEWVVPDPHRDATLKALEADEKGEPAMMLVSSYDRIDEELVTTIGGMLQYRHPDGRYQRIYVSRNQKLPGYAIVREIDADKSTKLSDGGYPVGSPEHQRTLDAKTAKEAYMQQVDADIASGIYGAKPQ